MRLAVALGIAAGVLATISFAAAFQPDGGAAGQGAFTIQPMQPAGVPVPDGPVLERKELEGGLIVEDIKIGEGYEVKPGGAVVAHYHGMLRESGKVFDSSFQRGEPAMFPLSGVIQGWQNGVPGMKIGGVRRLTIPAAMGYGEQGAGGGEIPPNADLIFVIELVDALQIEEMKVGEGEDAFGQFVAVTSHTIKNQEGEIVDRATADEPYIWLPGEFVGIQFGLEGMKVGGKRKLKVPSQMTQIPPGLETKRPGNVPLEIEVELIAVRNLQPRQQR
jgi:FKBP-type peptidyl-prolyl cis-trans isomerase